MSVLRGFGTTLDIKTGRFRSWYVDEYGFKRWADNDEPIDVDPGYEKTAGESE